MNHGLKLQRTRRSHGVSPPGPLAISSAKPSTRKLCNPWTDQHRICFHPHHRSCRTGTMSDAALPNDGPLSSPAMWMNGASRLDISPAWALRRVQDDCPRLRYRSARFHRRPMSAPRLSHLFSACPRYHRPQIRSLLVSTSRLQSHHHPGEPRRVENFVAPGLTRISRSPACTALGIPVRQCDHTSMCWFECLAGYITGPPLWPSAIPPIWISPSTRLGQPMSDVIAKDKSCAQPVLLAPRSLPRAGLASRPSSVGRLR